MDIIFSNDFKKRLVGTDEELTYFVDVIHVGRGIWKTVNVEVHEDLEQAPIMVGKFLYETDEYRRDYIRLLRELYISENIMKQEQMSRVIFYNNYGDITHEKIIVSNPEKYFPKHGMGLNVYFYEDDTGLFKSNRGEVIENLEESNMYIDIIRSYARDGEEYALEYKNIRR